MNGHYDEDWKDIDSGEVKADIDIDIEANPDSNTENIISVMQIQNNIQKVATTNERSTTRSMRQASAEITR
jgi:hypothetical protein